MMLFQKYLIAFIIGSTTTLKQETSVQAQVTIEVYPTTNLADAKSYCQGSGLALCTYEELCPNGENNPPAGGYVTGTYNYGHYSSHAGKGGEFGKIQTVAVEGTSYTGFVQVGEGTGIEGKSVPPCKQLANEKCAPGFNDCGTGKHCDINADCGMDQCCSEISRNSCGQPHNDYRFQCSYTASTEFETWDTNAFYYPWMLNVACCPDSAGGGGDPHFFGFGGTYFTWQGHCDLVLIKTPKLSNGFNLEAHVRTKKVRKWSAIDAIAVKVGQDVIEIQSNDGKLHLNGNKVESIRTEVLTVVKSTSASKRSVVAHDFVFDKETLLQVRVNTRTQMVYTTLSGNYPKGTVGLLGSPHNPGLITRDGIVMTNENVNKFAESWQVTDSDPHLFREDREPQYPSKCLYDIKEVKSNIRSRHLKEIHTIAYSEAVAACASHHAGPRMDFCIEDVLATMDLDSVEDSFYG